MAPRVGSGPRRALRIKTLGVTGSASQEALEDAEEECATISGTHNIEAMDCHESCRARSGRWLDKGGKHTIKGYIIGLNFLFTSNSYLYGRPNHHTDVEHIAASSKSLSPFSVVILYGLYTPSFTQISSVVPSFFYSTVHSISLQSLNCDK